MTTLRLGIDIGSTTIKFVVLDENAKIIYKNYERHFSETGNAFKRNLEKVAPVLGDNPFYITLSGSSGMGVASRLNLPFEQEVLSCTSAINLLAKDTETAIELGGEDAKITYLKGSLEQRMNGACAGGTGAFIDQMANLLNTDAKGLNDLAKKGSKLYTIASRCGVFAKTDIQALINDGAQKEDLALSIFQAVVNQTVGTLAQGRAIEGKTAFLGGPLTFLSELKERFIKTLNLIDEDVVATPDACYFVAIGAAICDEAKLTSLKELTELSKTDLNAVTETKNHSEPLFSSRDEYDAFVKRHSEDIVKRTSFDNYHGPVYVGIDAGSTTSKIAAVTDKNELLYTIYGSNQGSPLNTVVNELKELYDHMPHDCYIAGVTTTGYGESLIKAAKEAKLFGEVEIVASSEDKNYTYIPKGYTIPTDADYFHITTNNTIYGTEIKEDIDCPITLVADMSSDIMSRPVDVTKYGMIYGGAQKNVGPAGVTFVIIRKDLLNKVSRKNPTMVNYATHCPEEAKNKSMFNTPPVFPIFVMHETLKWVKEQGGVAEMNRRNNEKANLLYGEIDRNPMFKGTAVKEDRSIMNVCFVMAEGYEQYEQEFLRIFLNNLLKQGLVVLEGNVFHMSQGTLYKAEHEFRGRLYAAVKINGGKHRLKGVRQNGGSFSAAHKLLAVTEAEKFAHVKLRGKFAEGFFTDQRSA